MGAPGSQIDPRHDVLAMAYRAMSRDGTAEDIMTAFLNHARAMIDFDYFVNVVVDPASGGYRIMDRDIVPDVSRGVAATRAACLWTDPAMAPIVRGGFIGEVIGDEAPLTIEPIDIRDDPVVGDELAAYRRCLVIPVFHEGGADEWVLLFRGGDRPIEPAEASSALHICNLLSQMLKQRRLALDVADLNRRLHAKLHEVARVQRSILPAQTPAVDGLSMAVSYEPCDAAGGDYYDFRSFPDGRFGVVIADVSGHGPAAAVVMAMLRTVMAANRAQRRPAETVVPDVNAAIADALHEGMFVTAFFMALDPRTGDVQYANCGHPAPRVRRRDGRVEPLACPGVAPLGVLDELPGDAGGSGRLEPGDSVVLFTDGVIEAFDADRSMFGVPGLDAVLADDPIEPTRLIERIHTAVDRHTGAAAPTDDRCVVVVRYDGPGAVTRV